MVISSHPEWEDSHNRVRLKEMMGQPLFASIAGEAVTSRICVQCARQRFAAPRMNVSRDTSKMVPFAAYVDMVIMMNPIIDGRLTTLITKPLGTVRT